MIPSKEFRWHADECRRMAMATRDEAQKGTWSRMADRWLVCADLAEKLLSAAPRRIGPYVRPARRWDH